MAKIRMEVLQARMDLLSASLKALLQAMPPSVAAVIARDMRQQMTGRADSAAADVDEAVAADLAQLMSALLGPPVGAVTLQADGIGGRLGARDRTA